MKRTTVTNSHLSIARRENFDAGNLSGHSWPAGCAPAQSSYYSQLSGAWRERYIADRATYVVFSYNTPIFWIAEDGREVMPTRHYSTSTRRHQAQCVRTMSWNPWSQLREPAPYELEVA